MHLLHILMPISRNIKTANQELGHGWHDQGIICKLFATIVNSRLLEHAAVCAAVGTLLKSACEELARDVHFLH